MNIQKFSQKGIVINNGSVLLIKYSGGKYRNYEIAGKYALPGGKIEIGEGVDASIISEIKSETGITVNPAYASIAGIGNIKRNPISYKLML